LNPAQRVVVSIATGVALLMVGRAAETWQDNPGDGWFGYVPLTRSISISGPFLFRHPGLRLLMWLALIAVWTAVSLWLFGAGAGNRPTDEAP